jgi:ribonuclease R
MQDQIHRLLSNKQYIPSNIPQLLKGLGLAPNQQQKLQAALREMERAGRVARIKGNRYISPPDADLVPGRIMITRQGRGFLTPDDPTEAEISVAANELGTAFPGDHVLVRRDVKPTSKSKKKSWSDGGTVIRVLERLRTRFVGTLRRSKAVYYVDIDDPHVQHNIYVSKPTGDKNQAKVGNKVVVELQQWTTPRTNPEGKITEVLGAPHARGVDMLGVLRQYDLTEKFPHRVLQEVRQLGNVVTESDRQGRTDCRKQPVISIDPESARDFDDAFSLHRSKSGQWCLRVHIADVSHYVKPGSALDKEAHKRGNSTYLIDRVIPMLPEALSNELCSLKPHVDRLTKCVEFLLTDAGEVIRSRSFSAVIHSKQRFTYEEALNIIERKPKGEFEHMLHHAHKLAQHIRKKRFKNGALEFEFPEIHMELDARGHIKNIARSGSDVAHQLIEEFMLLTNEAVAGRLMKLKRPTIYRVHEAPKVQRLESYRQDILRHSIPCGDLSDPREVQKLLRRLQQHPLGDVLKIGYLKSLNRACYSTDPLGHYGLAKDKYAHFTSPIRRYADLVVHRSLFDNPKVARQSLQATAAQLSQTERNAADAERDSRLVKLHAYLHRQLKSGKLHRYPATITDLRNFGFFVDIHDLGISSIVPLSVLEDDFYEYNAEKNQIIGRKSKRRLKLGSKIDVEIAKIDASKKSLEFRIAPR